VFLKYFTLTGCHTLSGCFNSINISLLPDFLELRRSEILCGPQWKYNLKHEADPPIFTTFG
jgi:hypothetical protein